MLEYFERLFIMQYTSIIYILLVYYIYPYPRYSYTAIPLGKLPLI